MKKLLLGSVVSIALLAGGCANVSEGVPLGIVPERTGGAVRNIHLSQPEAIAKWHEFNSACRGYGGPTACAEREKVGAALNAAGLCHGKPGQAGYEMKWEVCSVAVAAPAPISAVPSPTAVPLGEDIDQCMTPPYGAKMNEYRAWMKVIGRPVAEGGTSDNWNGILQKVCLAKFSRREDLRRIGISEKVIDGPMVELWLAVREQAWKAAQQMPD